MLVYLFCKADSNDDESHNRCNGWQCECKRGRHKHKHKFDFDLTDVDDLVDDEMLDDLRRANAAFDDEYRRTHDMDAMIADIKRRATGGRTEAD